MVAPLRRARILQNLTVGDLPAERSFVHPYAEWNHPIQDDQAKLVKQRCERLRALDDSFRMPFVWCGDRTPQGLFCGVDRAV